MKKVIFFSLFIICFSNAFIYAQSDTTLTITNTHHEKSAWNTQFFISYDNLSNSQGDNYFVGGGVSIYDNRRLLGLNVTILFPVGDKSIDFTSVGNFSLGTKLFTHNSTIIKDLSICFIPEIGASYLIMDFQNRTEDYTGFYGSMGIECKYKFLFLNIKAGPMFSTGPYNFNHAGANLGVCF